MEYVCSILEINDVVLYCFIFVAGCSRSDSEGLEVYGVH